MSSVYSAWIDTICVPAELRCLCCPLLIFESRSTTSDLLTIPSIPVKKLVSPTDCSQGLRVHTPIKAMDVGAMTFAHSDLFIPGVDIINTDSVIV